VRKKMNAEFQTLKNKCSRGPLTGHTHMYIHREWSDSRQTEAVYFSQLLNFIHQGANLSTSGANPTIFELTATMPAL
jgi:hypothetical protein